MRLLIAQSVTDSQSAADFDDWWPRALSRPPLLTALPQPRCLIQGGATTRAGRERQSAICAAQMSSASSASRTPIAGLSYSAIAYDVLHVVHYFAGAKVEDNLTVAAALPSAVGEMKANVLGSVGCLPA